jgi:hypothetical protein
MGVVVVGATLAAAGARVMEEVEDFGMGRGNAAGADFPSLSGCIHAAPGRPILLYDTDTGAGLFAERFEADSKAGDAGADDNHVVDHSLFVPIILWVP